MVKVEVNSIVSPDYDCKCSCQETEFNKLRVAIQMNHVFKLTYHCFLIQI